MHMYTSRVLQDGYPFSDSEQVTTVDTDLSLAITTAQKNSQAVTLREAVAWALFSLMTLMFIGTLSVATILLCTQKYKQKRDNTAEAPGPAAYEMDSNPCYGSSKTDNYTYGTDIYEPIDTERV